MKDLRPTSLEAAVALATHSTKNFQEPRTPAAGKADTVIRGGSRDGLDGD